MTLRRGKTDVVTIVTLMVLPIVKMAQRNLAKNGRWGKHSNILKITVACVEKIMVSTTLKLTITLHLNDTSK